MRPGKKAKHRAVSRVGNGFLALHHADQEISDTAEPGRSGTMRRTTIILTLLTALAGVGSSIAATATTFVHTASAANITSFVTYLDNPRLDDDSVFPIVTQNWNPGGVGGTYNNHPIGVAFDYGGEDLWMIVNLDESPMPLGASFNVHLVSSSPDLVMHIADASNTSSFYTTLSHPLLNDNPDAIAHVTQVHTAYPDNHPYSLLYGDDLSLSPGWNIANMDIAPMPTGGGLGPFFLVLVLNSNPNAFRHDANPSNLTSNWTTIDSPLLNGHPEAIVLVTGVEPDADTAVLNAHELGVWYTGSTWAIFNQDFAPMLDGTKFNVFVASSVFFDGFESGDLTAWSSSVP